MDSMIKPLATGLTAGLIQKYVYADEDMNKVMMFAGAVAIGQYGSQFVTPLASMLPNMPSISDSLYDGKTLAVRIVEVGSTSGIAYLVNKYLLNNDIYTDELYQRLMIIAASDVIGEYISDYMAGRSLNYLTDSA